MSALQVREVGRIREIKKSIARVTGLRRVMNGQLLEVSEVTRGLVVGFQGQEVLAFLLGRIEDVRVGDPVYSELKPFTLPAGEAFLGRIVNALGEPIDGKEKIVDEAAVMSPVFRPAPGILEREPLSEALETGTLVIDAVIPIGKGQRQLIIGDRMTGKTTLALDAILHQKDKGTVCIYCCVGKSFSAFQKAVEVIKRHGALSYTIVVEAHAAASTGEQYLCPYTACMLGEYFMDRGRNVLVVFDDLTKHAWAYRQLSLLLERPLGREAYPGDIFYIHSQLMERAGRYSSEFGRGSMTFLPIVETLQGDVTGYVPSNLVSMTDGQIYLDADLFNSGVKPAVDLGLSVSRIGNKVQTPAMRELSGTLRLEYVRYREIMRMARFQSSLLGDAPDRVKQGEVLRELFRQGQHRPYSLFKQVVLLYAFKRGVLKVMSMEEGTRFQETIVPFIQERDPSLPMEVESSGVLTAEAAKRMDRLFVLFFKKDGDKGRGAAPETSERRL